MTNADKDFRNAEILYLGPLGEIVSYPAFDYVHSTNPDSPICADKGGRHLGEMVPGIAVAFPTRTHGLMHKHFGICFDDDGTPLAYGKGTCLTSDETPKETLAAAHLGDPVLIKGKVYTIAQTPNDNIEFIEA